MDWRSASKIFVGIHDPIDNSDSCRTLSRDTVFCLQYYLEPPEALRKAMEEAGLPTEDFFVLKHGETKSLPEPTAAADTQ